MFKLQRFYSWTSFIVIFIGAALLTLFYRQVTMRWIDHLAETNHQVVAATALNAVHPELVAYLVGQHTDPALDPSHGLPPGLAEKIRRLTMDNTVERIDIYDYLGHLMFTTQNRSAKTFGQVEDAPAQLPHVDEKPVSALLIHEDFSRPEGFIADGSLILTHIPIRKSPGEPVIGIFSIRSDMSHLTEESNRIMLLILVGGELILAILYAILVIVVRHAKKIIDSQQSTIRERNASLEALSKKLMESEEIKRKKIATDLHEGLAQTLSAIKVNFESKAPGDAADTVDARVRSSVVPVLQQAIQEVRSIATELRPSSLDDLGLLPTLNWYCREFESLHPQIRVQREIELSEGKIPAHLKIEIYRIIESAFKNIAKYSNTDRILCALHLTKDMIHLVIGDMPTLQPEVAGITHFAPKADSQFRFAEVMERTALSGGTFSSSQEKAGWVTLRSSWTCAG